MIANTFQHIPGIGKKTEENLWYSGIKDWNCFKDNPELDINKGKNKIIRQHIDESEMEIRNNNPYYFSERLPSNLSWRIFSEFRDTAVYLDIETDGLDFHFGTITTIAMYDGKNIFHYVNGKNLDDFTRDIQKYQMIISYNGKTFDIPFIEKYFNINIELAHIDLRYVLGSLGFKGGLKACEKKLGIDRGDLKGVDGYFAVLLWDEYKKTGNPNALETLLAYNIEDVVNLEVLMIKAFNLKLEQTPFYENNYLPLPDVPVIPFRPDLRIVDKIRNKALQYSQI